MNTTSYSSIATMTSSIKRCAIGAIIFGLFLCEKHLSSNYLKVNDNYKPSATVAQITNKLNSSFSQNKPDSLESFLQTGINQLAQTPMDSFMRMIQ